MVVRAAGADDLDCVVTLAQSAAVYEPDSVDMEQTDVVCQGNHVIAFATWQAVCDEATLLGIAVAEAYRRQGIARKLLAYGEARLLQDGIRQFFLEVRASNSYACHLYQRTGYHCIGERKDYYPLPDGGREAAVMMCKTI